MTTSTFDMAKVSAKTKKSGATWKQCKALGYHLAKKSSTDYVAANQEVDS